MLPASNSLCNSVQCCLSGHYTPFLQQFVYNVHSQQYCIQFFNSLQFAILSFSNNCQQYCLQSIILLSSNIFQFTILSSSNNCQQSYLQSTILFSSNSFQFVILPSSNNCQYCLHYTTLLSSNSLWYPILPSSNTLPNFLLFFQFFLIFF